MHMEEFLYQEGHVRVDLSLCNKHKSTSKISFISFHFISFQIFKEGGPSVVTDLQGALRLH